MATTSGIADLRTEWEPLDVAEERSLAPPGTVVMVADEANRLIFVSQAAAELLGWEQDDLIGRRLTAIIPPALREAHLASFTRFQVTGEGEVGGAVDLRVPAMRKDGSELEVELLIEPVRRSKGRQVLRAVIATP